MDLAINLRRWLGRDATAWLRDCTSVGVGAQLSGRPWLRNEGRLSIGQRFQLSSLPVVSHLVTAPGGVLEIGDDVTLSYGAAIFSASRISIGTGSRIGPFAVISDTDFHVVGQREAAPAPRPVSIGRDVRIGARVTVLPGSTIGDGATVAAGSTVAGNVAARASVAGAPARELRAAGGEDASSASSLEEAVQALVARVLGLRELPSLLDGPGEIPEWDSLGALRLLLALEDQMNVPIGERDMIGARRVADLVAIVDRARAHGRAKE